MTFYHNFLQYVLHGTDVDECSLGMSNCVEVATCKNTDGGYTCVCMPGYMGNATVCQGTK